MRVYLKFFRLFLVLVIGVFFLVGSGGGGGDDKTTTPTKPITILDSTNETISQNEIKTLLENNETTYTKSFTLDDKKTKVKLSFDLLENNVTKDIKLDVEKLDYKEDVLWAKIIKLSSNAPLKNIEIEVLNNTEVFNRSYRKIVDKSSNKYTVATMGEAPIAFSYESNFLDILYNLKLNLKNNKYILSAKLKNKIKQLHLQVFDNNKNEVSNELISNTKEIEFLFNKIDERYNLNFYITAPPFYNKRISLFSLVLTTDFITDNEIISKKTLSQTRVNENDILNNFMESDERKYPFIMEETTTHRITDFDKLLNSKSKLLPSLWKSSSYGKSPQNDNGRMPLILVHGWDGTIGKLSRETRRDPTKLLLWENAEFHYWHNFLAYYLTSEKLQKKYHIYFYRYTSYKHIAYSAKIFNELLTKVSEKTDLGMGLKKEENGVTIIAHSMGGMVSRAMIEEFEGLGKDAKKLKKLITLDTPHRGSVGSVNEILADLPKDLNTHGAMDLNYDNFDNMFSASELKKLYNDRRKNNGLEKFDREYCNRLNEPYTTCMDNTANPYMKYVNKILEQKSSIYSKKYIFYTAWMATNLESFSTPFYGTDIQAYQNAVLDLTYNNISDLNYIKNGVMDVSTAFMGKFKYSAGGAESVGSSIFSSNKDSFNYSSFFNPKNNEAPSIDSASTYDFYHKDVSLNDICMYTTKNLKDESVCIDKRNIKLALITNSIGEDHPYKIPYRLFWDYDHETIFNGTAKDRGEWDKYINSSSTFSKTTNSDTRFNNYRTQYVQGAMKIRYGEEPNNEGYSADNLNPLTYEPVFLVLEKDLLTSVTNGDIDEDKLPDEWEEANGLRWVNADDAKEDSDNDGLTNLQEYNNGKNSTDPQNEDSDGDGFKDGEEVTAGTNPNDKDDYPITKELTLELTNKQTCETTGKCDFKVGIPNNGKSYNATLSFGDGGSVSMSTSTASIDGLNITPTLYSYSTQTHEYQQTGTYTTTLEANVDSEDLDSKSLDVVVSSIGGTAISTSKVKKTGQTQTYYPKDDGNYQKGIEPNYSRNGDIVTDLVTGLQWQDNEEVKTVTKNWEDAKIYCSNNVSLNGFNDWRLPTAIELKSIIDYGENNPSIDSIFINTNPYFYWSSTTLIWDARYAFYVHFNHGNMTTNLKGFNAYVRCVRAGTLSFKKMGSKIKY